MAQEVAQSFVDRQGLLRALGEPIDVRQDPQFGIAQLEVQLPAATQFAEEQQQAPPEEKALVISDQYLPARVRQLARPEVEFRAEVPDGANEALSEAYDLPALRRRSVAWA